MNAELSTTKSVTAPQLAQRAPKGDVFAEHGEIRAYKHVCYVGNA